MVRRYKAPCKKLKFWWVSSNITMQHGIIMEWLDRSPMKMHKARNYLPLWKVLQWFYRIWRSEKPSVRIMKQIGSLLAALFMIFSLISIVIVFKLVTAHASCFERDLWASDFYSSSNRVKRACQPLSVHVGRVENMCIIQSIERTILSKPPELRTLGRILFFLA